ncbi:MAG: EAL domain-containing protein [Alphaproteobacteria bacterium]|nr:MAG: EAL domain-containing protein [Alphaproteobacteria bacterium]
MVPEQDLILRLRHFKRAETAVSVLNLCFESLPEVRARGQALRDRLFEQLERACASVKAECRSMSNGDAFVLLPVAGRDLVRDEALVIAACLPDERKAAVSVPEGLVLRFRMPQDYMPLRERTNHYLEAARAAETFGGSVASAEKALQTEEAYGPLSAWSLSYLEQWLGNVSIRRYVRTQAAYTRQGTTWEVAFQEYAIGLGDLRRAHFPHVDLDSRHGLFLDLCRTLDRRLLEEMTENAPQWAGQAISMNLALETVFQPIFPRLCAVLTRPQRACITFEIHHQDLLRDMRRTRTAIDILHREGFHVLADGVSPDLLPVVDFAALGLDGCKITASSEWMETLRQPAIRQAMDRLPPTMRRVFGRVDSKEALELGLDWDVKIFQGWLLDDLATGEK